MFSENRYPLFGIIALTMPCLMRPATPEDLPSVVTLLIRDARERSVLDHLLWREPADLRARIEKSFGAAFKQPQASAQELWLVAENAGRIVGLTHALIVLVTPIYDSGAGSPGLLLDDCFISDDAPSGTAEALWPPRPRWQAQGPHV